MSQSTKHFVRHYVEMLWSGLVTGISVLMIIEHVAMLLAMAGAMLLRPAEYMHPHAHAAAQVTA
jgi:hypothetical protein